MNNTSAIEFYMAWLASVNNSKDALFNIRSNRTELVNHINTRENSIIEDVAKTLGLLYAQTDSFDALLYKEADMMPGVTPDSLWFREIKVTIELENNGNKDLFQKTSQLLLTNANLKVLVAYPNGNPQDVLGHLHKMIHWSKQSKDVSDTSHFMAILGLQNGVEWEGLIYCETHWEKINNGKIEELIKLNAEILTLQTKKNAAVKNQEFESAAAINDFKKLVLQKKDALMN